MNAPTALAHLRTIDDHEYDRRKWIGGSDIAGIVGVQPPKWKTAVEIWARKIDDEPAAEPPEAVRKRLARGTIVEPLVATLLAQMHGLDVLVRNRRYVDPDIPYFAAEVDAEIPFEAVRHLFPEDKLVEYLGTPMFRDDEIVNLEIKTVHPFASKEWGEEGTDDVPVHYAAQVLWGIGVTRRRLAICAALFGADELVLYPVIMDGPLLDRLIRGARSFWLDHVVPRIAPAPQTLADCALLWPTDAGTAVEADDELVAFLRTYRAMAQRYTSLGDAKEGLAVEIRESVRDAAAITIAGEIVATCKSHQHTSIDADTLKSRFPDAYKACVRKTTVRPLRLKDGVTL
jgi:putative phage-type endonuclease